MLFLAAMVGAPVASPVLVVDHARLAPAEKAMVLTAQGLANRESLRVWMRTTGFASILEPEIKKRYGLEEVASSWGLIEKLGKTVKGGIVYKLGTPSLNVATSLCGPMDAVAIDESLLDKAKRQGINILRDVRGMNERQLWAENPALFAKKIAFEQVLDKPGHLRDLAVANNAFIFDAPNSAWRTQIARAVGPNAMVYGWGRDEFTWIADLARGGAVGVPADWSLNLSALKHWKVKLKRPQSASVPRPSTPHRTVAFVISDGDNIQWLGGKFAIDKGFWASRHRGKFPVSWEVAPILADAGPAILDHLYRTATPNDDFVVGPGVPSYTFPHQQPNMRSLAAASEGVLRRADLRVVSILNDNAGSMSEADAVLALKGVDALIYKDYSPYNRRKGAIRRVDGKLCVAYKFLLWEGLTDIDALAKQIKTMPTDPASPESYALINVHAWSFGKIGGPMEAVSRTVAKLGAGTRVVTASQLLRELRSVK